MNNPESRYVFISGTDRGLGFELVKQFLMSGSTVFAGRYMPDWAWPADFEAGYGDRLRTIHLDISDDASVNAAADFVRGHTDRLDVLVNNAAILGPIEDAERTIFTELDFDTMRKVFEVNTLGTLRVTHALIPLVMNSPTKLVATISSEAGSVEKCWRPGMYAYCMSKAALNMESAVLHTSIRDRGGQVMVFHPGWMQTYMEGTLNTKADLPPEKSAAGIRGLIERHEEFRGEKPVFLDHLGNRWPW